VLAVAPAQETTDDDMLCIGMIRMENERGKEEHCLPALQQALYSMDGKVVSSEIDQLRHDRESGFFCGAPHRPVRHRSRSHYITSFAIAISKAVSCEKKIPLETIVHSLY
jgi:hypothetical protein